MQLPVASKNDGESVDVSDIAFAGEFNEGLVHQVVTACLAGARSGTRAQKNRSDVRGGGTKPWRQKGTGRARAGTIRSPLWRGGGQTFAARPQNFTQKINKKMYRAAMRGILSELVRQDRLMVVDEISVSAPKTKEMLGNLDRLGMKKGLLVTESDSVDLYLSVRNIPFVDVVEVSELNPVSLVGAEKVVMTVDALKKVEEWLG